jgi:outer membrane protein
MKIKKAIAVILATSGFWQVPAQDTIMRMSLKQACQLGIERNVNVVNAGLEKQKTRYQVKETQSRLYPAVEGYSNFNYYYAIPKLIVPGEIFGQTGLIPIEIGTRFDWVYGFKASQVLFNQSCFISLKMAQRMLIIGELNLQQKKEEIVYQVSQVYTLCQATCEQIVQLRKSVRNLDRLIEIAILQKENGVIRPVDCSRVSVNRSNLLTQIDNLSQLYDQQLGMLRYLINLNPDNRIELTDSLTPSTTALFPDIPDFGNRTEVLLIDRQMEITSLARKISRKSYLPTLSGIGQYYYEGQRNTFDFLKGGSDKFYKVGFIGLSLNVPIFNGFEKQYRIRQDDIALMQLQNTKQNTTAYFTREYSDAIRQYANSMNILTRQLENIRVAEETYNISLQGYLQQVTPLSDLLLSESSMAETRLSYYNALMELKNAELDVKKTRGELLNF